MPTLEDQEYVALTRRGQDAERIAQLCWIAGGLAGSVMMSWAIAAKSPGHMIPVVFAIAIGFYGSLRARQQVRWIAGYIEGFHEDPKGAQWFTRLRRLQEQPGYRTVGDLVTVSLANAGVLLALMLAWMYAGPAPRGDLMAGIATVCGVLFGFHSISETVRMAQTDGAAMWRKVSGELKEAPRAQRAASW
jgi:hypothetical protein